MKSLKYIFITLLYFIIVGPALYIFITKFNFDFIVILLCFIITFGFVALIFKLESARIKNHLSNEVNLLYNILNDISAIFIVWSEDLSVFNLNDSFYSKTGYDEGYFNKKENIKKLFKNASVKSLVSDNSVELRLVCADLSELTVVWKTTVVQDGKNKIYLSIGTDCTEVVNIQDKLSASENKLEMSMELSEIGLLFRYVEADEYFVSANLQKLFGFSSQNISIEQFESKIHPKDIGIYCSYLNNLKDYADINKHDIVNLEIRIECADGGYHWFNYRFKLSTYTNNNQPVIGGCLIDISNDKEKDTLIEKMAYIDEVTQIFNRNRFMMLGQETYSCSKELGLSYWLIILDVDKFHIINDTCGYQNGNRLLKEIAITIIKNMSDGGFCARIGGDNFAILLKDNGDEEYPVDTIKSIQNALLALNSDVFANQTISVSAGYCKLPGEGDDFAEVLEHSEFALGLGELPRSNITRYDNSVHDKIIQKTTIEKELEKALKNNELKLFYQPKINLTNNKIMGVEALIRWIKPDGTIIPPTSFISVAENSNLITKISEFVINEACMQNKQWQDKGLPPINISVNLSSVDFYQTDVCSTIKKAIEKSGMSPEWLEIELTESLALKDVDQAIKQMLELKRLGIKISMDDFGTGYSSLSYIQVLPIAMLKLDRSFIMNLEDDEVSRQIVSAVINICKSKKIEIIAEGIETCEQADILRDSGCDHAQGYFFGKPMPSSTFEEYLQKAI